MAVRAVDGSGVEEGDAEAAARSRRAMEPCTRGAEVVAKVLLGRVATLLSPLRRLKSRRSALAWIRTTQSGARSWLVDSAVCAVAVRFVNDVAVEEDFAEAAARSRRAIVRCTRGVEIAASSFLDMQMPSLTT